MRISRPRRDCTITFTVTKTEKAAIANMAEKEKRTIGGYIRYRLNDVLESAKEGRDD